MQISALMQEPIFQGKLWNSRNSLKITKNHQKSLNFMKFGDFPPISPILVKFRTFGAQAQKHYKYQAEIEVCGAILGSITKFQ